MNITVAAFADELPSQSLASNDALFSKNLTEEQITDIKQHISDVIRIEELNKQETNSTYKITTSSGKSFFYKEFTKDDKNQILTDSDSQSTQDFSTKIEVGASTIASYISNGLIPQGKAIKHGIIYPYIEINNEKTKEIFGDDSDSFNYEKLTSEQQAELFISMLCDMVLLNPDTHPKHFALTQEGHLISFNKKYAYSSILTAKDITEDSVQNNFLVESKIYKGFIRELQNHPEKLEKLLTNPQVNEALLRVNALAILQTERKYVQQTLDPLFALIKGSVDNNDKEEQFSNSYFTMLKKIPRLLAYYLNDKRVFFKDAVTIKKIKDDSLIATFNPKVNKMLLITAAEQGYATGAKVSEIAKKAGVEVAMNGGFFTYGESSSGLLGWLAGKAISKTRQYSGGLISIGEDYAIPNAIQKANNKLYSDTNDYLPALGISDSGDVKMGEVKVVWSAKLFEDGRKIMLDRISDIEPDIMNAIIYYKDGSDIKGVSILNNQVISIDIVAETAKEVSNCYWLHDPSKKDIDEFNSLKIGDYLSYGYELVAATYTGQSESIDPELTSFFNNCPYVVSGGQLLMKDGEVDPRISKSYKNERLYRTFGTAVCSHKDGTISLITEPYGDMYKDNFAALLKEVQCEDAISLDGGGSSSLFVGTSNKEVYGYNQVVSDIIGVMPRYSNVLLSQYLKDHMLLESKNIDPNVSTTVANVETFIFAAYTGNESLLRAFVSNYGVNPNTMLEDKSVNALMAAAKQGHIGCVKLLLSYPQVNSNLVNKDGETAFSLAIKNGHTECALILAKDHRFDPTIVDKRGNTVLMVAAEMGCAECIGLFLNNPKINPNSVNKDGKTALSLAIKNHNTKCISMLAKDHRAEGGGL